MKRRRAGIMILVLIISIIEICLIINSIYKYKGVHQVYSLAPIVALLLYGCFKILYQKKKENKVKIISLILITIIAVALTILTRPTYSYNDGKVLVEKYLESSEDNFNEVEIDRKLVPVTYEKKHLLVGKLEYYYKYRDDINDMFFIVNPLTGKVTELKDKFD